MAASKGCLSKATSGSNAMSRSTATSLGDVTSAVVLYHHPCIDGIFAALAAHSYFKQREVPCRFVPHRVYEAIDPLQLKVSMQDTVFLCDYIGPSPEFAIQLCQRTRRSVLIEIAAFEYVIHAV